MPLLHVRWSNNEHRNSFQAYRIVKLICMYTIQYKKFIHCMKWADGEWIFFNPVSYAAHATKSKDTHGIARETRKCVAHVFLRPLMVSIYKHIKNKQKQNTHQSTWSNEVQLSWTTRRRFVSRPCDMEERQRIESIESVRYGEWCSWWWVHTRMRLPTTQGNAAAPSVK